MLALSNSDAEEDGEGERDLRADLDCGVTVVKSEDESKADDVTIDVIALEKLPLAVEEPLDVAHAEVVAEGDDVGVYEIEFVAVTVGVTLPVDDADSDAIADIVNCDADLEAELIAVLV